MVCLFYWNFSWECSIYGWICILRNRLLLFFFFPFSFSFFSFFSLFQFFSFFFFSSIFFIKFIAMRNIAEMWNDNEIEDNLYWIVGCIFVSVICIVLVTYITKKAIDSATEDYEAAKLDGETRSLLSVSRKRINRNFFIHLFSLLFVFFLLFPCF